MRSLGPRTDPQLLDGACAARFPVSVWFTLMRSKISIFCVSISALSALHFHLCLRVLDRLFDLRGFGFIVRLKFPRLLSKKIFKGCLV